jgi:parallel beta-helix repeat protein
MGIPRAPLLTLLFALGLLAVTPHPALAAKIKCGSVLGPGGTFVLNRDLTCPPSPSDYLVPALTVLAGATLDLNGHTVSCGLPPLPLPGSDYDPRRDYKLGINVVGSTIRNGTVTGCATAVSVGNGVVKNVTVSESGAGIAVSDDSRIIGNVAIRNSFGFSVREDARRNTFINNTARENVHAGFSAFLSSRDSVFIGNTAIRNATGFLVDGAISSRMLGNQARKNGVGFWFDGGTKNVELIGNVAKGNRSHGFSLEYLGGYLNTIVVVRDNMAQGNGGDGFLIGWEMPDVFSFPPFQPPADPATALLQDNHAIDNNGHGIHVIAGESSHATIAGNTAIGHTAPHFDLADDNANCQDGLVWQDNHFLTASQSCIE